MENIVILETFRPFPLKIKGSLRDQEASAGLDSRRGRPAHVVELSRLRVDIVFRMIAVQFFAAHEVLEMDMAARFAAKLATSTAKGAWADYVIELYDAQQRPCPAPVIEELYNAFRKVNAIDLGRLRAYLGRLREKQGSFGPAERFLIQRLEGLERLAALR